MDPDSKTNQDEQRKNPALGLIRQKISKLYEPNVKRELEEAKASHKRSKHQQFMYELSTSGKSLAEIQTAWHNYYIGLPDDQKHQVWQEFYAANEQNNLSIQQPKADHAHHDSQSNHVPWSAEPEPKTKRRSITDLKSELTRRTDSGHRKPSRKHHLKSLLFGISMGSLVIILLLFSFFNERFIAPFITPSRAVSSTPIIIDPNSVATGPDPKIIIPKINVELPVVFDEQSVDDKAVETSLEDGVLHYPTTSYPGELGTGAIFGHSSNNILNKGKYKFAFVMLKRLESGDTFMIQYKGKRYVYKVYDKRIVSPNDVGVLTDASKSANFELITCDPPGTSINRLVVFGEQVNPDPSTNVASTANKTAGTPKILPSNAPSLWQRLVGLLSG